MRILFLLCSVLLLPSVGADSFVWGGPPNGNSQVTLEGQETPSPSPSPTPTPTATETSSATLTTTPTPTISDTPSPSFSNTPTISETPSPSFSNTPTISETPSPSHTNNENGDINDDRNDDENDDRNDDENDDPNDDNSNDDQENNNSPSLKPTTTRAPFNTGFIVEYVPPRGGTSQTSSPTPTCTSTKTPTMTATITLTTTSTYSSMPTITSSPSPATLVNNSQTIINYELLQTTNTTKPFLLFEGENAPSFCANNDIRCKGCPQGFYLSSLELCESCPSFPILSTFIIPLSTIVGSFLGFCLLILLITIPITKRYGGTTKGGFERSVLFLLASWNILQVISQFTQNLLKTSSQISNILKSFVNVFSFLNFSMPSPPSACLSLPPFTSQIILFSILLFVLGLTTYIFISKKQNNPLRFFRNISILALFSLYGPLSSQIFETLSCTTLPNNLRVVTDSPTIECMSGNHYYAYILACISAIFYSILLPSALFIYAKKTLNDITQSYNMKLTSQIISRLNTDSKVLKNDKLLPLVNGTYFFNYYWFRWVDIGLLLGIIVLNEFWISKNGYIPPNVALFCVLFGANTFLLLYFRPYKDESKFLLPSRCLTNITLMLFTIFLSIPNFLYSDIVAGILVGLLGLSILSLFIAYGHLLIKGAQFEQFNILKRRTLLKNLLKLLNGTDDLEKTVKFLKENNVHNPEDLLEQAYVDQRNDINRAIQNLEKVSQNQVYFQLANPLLAKPYSVAIPIAPSRQPRFSVNDKTLFTPQRVRGQKP